MEEFVTSFGGPVADNCRPYCIIHLCPPSLSKAYCTRCTCPTSTARVLLCPLLTELSHNLHCPLVQTSAAWHGRIRAQSESVWSSSLAESIFSPRTFFDVRKELLGVPLVEFVHISCHCCYCSQLLAAGLLFGHLDLHHHPLLCCFLL